VSPDSIIDTVRIDPIVLLFTLVITLAAAFLFGMVPAWSVFRMDLVNALGGAARYISADSLAYLSLDGLKGAVPGGQTKYCTSCYTGVYPVSFPQNEEAYLQLALKAVD